MNSNNQTVVAVPSLLQINITDMTG